MGASLAQDLSCVLQAWEEGEEVTDVTVPDGERLTTCPGRGVGMQCVSVLSTRVT